MMADKRRLWQRPLFAIGAVLLSGGVIAGGVFGAVRYSAVTAEPVPPRMATGLTVGVPWVADDGTAFAVLVSPADLDAFLARRAAWLADEKGRIAEIADRLAAAEANAVFVRMVERVPQFTDWIYGWFESYFAAYLIAEKAIEQLLFGDASGKSVGVGASVEGAFRGVLSAKFEQIVVRPVSPHGALLGSWDRLSNEVRREWQGVLASDRRMWDEFLFARSQLGRPIDERDADRPICAVMPDLTALDPDGQQLRERLDPQHADLFALRFARPYAARVTIIGLRFAGLGPTLGTAGATGALGVGVGAAGSVAVISGVVSAAIWALDYAINLLDEALYRAEFETRVVAALMDAENLEAREMAARATAAIGEAMAALAKCGAPPVLAVAAPANP